MIVMPWAPREPSGSFAPQLGQRFGRISFLIPASILLRLPRPPHARGPVEGVKMPAGAPGPVGGQQDLHRLVAAQAVAGRRRDLQNSRHLRSDVPGASLASGNDAHGSAPVLGHTQPFSFSPAAFIRSAMWSEKGACRASSQTLSRLGNEAKAQVQHNSTSPAFDSTFTMMSGLAHRSQPRFLVSGSMTTS